LLWLDDIIMADHRKHHHNKEEHKKEADDDVITRRVILRESGDFDMENIRYLTLGGRLVRDVSVVGACLNLVELNLSANLIADVSSLGKLTCLQVLDLRSNRISNIEPLSSLEKLEKLNLAGNLLATGRQLTCLSQLSELKSLTLDDGDKLSNPICKLDAYPQLVIGNLNKIIDFDGMRIRGVGSKFYRMCTDVINASSPTAALNGENGDCENKDFDQLAMSLNNNNISGGGGGGGGGNSSWFQSSDFSHVTSSSSSYDVVVGEATRKFERLLNESRKLLARCHANKCADVIIS